MSAYRNSLDGAEPLRRARRYAYLGPAASFTEAALLTLPEAAEGECMPFPSVAAALAALRDGTVDAALAPLENSVEGAVPSTLAELVSADPLRIAAETHVRIEFALLAAADTRLNNVTTVLSHPHALAQCRRWLQQWLPQAQVENAASTSAAARVVAEAGPQSALAALAAPIAAARYGLKTLAEDVGDRGDAVTRFILLRRPGPLPPPSGCDRTSFVARAHSDDQSWLRDVLDSFAIHNVPVTRIDPRPSGAGLGRYVFLLDCEGHISDAAVAAAWRAVDGLGAETQFLGSYPRDPAYSVRRTHRMVDLERPFDASGAWRRQSAFARSACLPTPDTQPALLY